MTFLEILAATPWLFFTTVTALGLIVGSFLNVLILRLPRMMEQEWQRDCAELQGLPAPEQETLSLSRPASHCPGCKSPIKPWQNIPVVSYLWLRGRCANCSQPIGLRYPAVELASGALSLAAAVTFGPSVSLLTALLFIWLLLALTGIDIDTQLLPDNLTLPLLWLGLAANLFNVWIDLPSAVIGAMAGYLSLWSVYWLFKLVTGKEGMGFGDFKLLAALGAWFGWQALPLIILLSSFVGAAIGITFVLVRGQDRNVPMPFGPYLAGAGLLYLFYGEPLNTLYLSLTGIQ